jgi:hypothetical protein
MYNVTLAAFMLISFEFNEVNRREFLFLKYNSVRGGMRIGYWWESQKERDHWEDQDVDGWTILKWILER